jgi:hypothetical protein
MATKIKPLESHIKLATPELPSGVRSGGEKRPFGYPHLYQIQAGDWRISYAVEHDRLAILVLEVLKPDGESTKDPARETMTKKMKVKLLDWPEGSGSPQIPPEEISKKLKIKWLDLAEEAEDSPAEATRGTSRIKLKGSSEKKASSRTSAGTRKITLLEAGEPIAADPSEPEESAGDETVGDGRKITPVDEPSMD